MVLGPTKGTEEKKVGLNILKQMIRWRVKATIENFGNYVIRKIHFLFYLF